ncbi:MAG TPA: hypothetical protein VG756_27175 [Pseudonocardiaceae bacterium]|jgi:hypothetical protein|nr:hypothetical protein [Pseudonocardiaceae bacterium]
MAGEQAVPPSRTVCHHCRGVTTVTAQVEPEQYRTRTMVVPGDGTITRMIASGGGGEVAVTEDCPVCGDSEDPGWVPGFVPPV